MGLDEGSGGPPEGPQLQFDKVEHDSPAAPPACARCQQRIDQEYFEVAGHLFCRTCVGQLDGGKGLGGFLRALGFGAGAALIGTLVWFAIIKLFNIELGLLAIGVGLLVGFAVRKGARGLGGWKYQAVAMALTYMSITASYVPLLIKELAAMSEKKANAGEAEKSPAQAAGTAAQVGSSSAEAAGTTAPAADGKGTEAPPTAGQFVLAMLVLFGFAFASPFLGGVDNIMGLIIIGIALYEAWKINKRVPIAGPFRLGGEGGAPGTAEPVPSDGPPPAPSPA